MQITSQEHPERPSEPIKYGDVFDVSSELASQPIAPQDAVTLKAGENVVLGQKGVPVALLESAANLNEQRGMVGHENMTDIVRDRSAVTIVETEVDSYCSITEAIEGQVIGRYSQSVDVNVNPRIRHNYR